MTLQDLRAFISVSHWTFAKTMPTMPHEYTVRGWDPLRPFTEISQYIQETGYVRHFRGRTYRTVDVDGWQYWTMGEAPDATTVINRASIDDGR